LPMRALGREYFHHDVDAQTLMGADTGLTIGIGDRVVVKLAAAVPVTGGLELELLEIDGERRKPFEGRGRGKGKGPHRRKFVASKAKSDKLKKKKLRKRT